MTRKTIVRFVVRLARAFETRPGVSRSDRMPIDPALLPIDLATRPMSFN